MHASMYFSSLYAGIAIVTRVPWRGCMVMMVARLPCNVDACAEHQRTSERGRGVEGFLPHECAHEHGHQRLREAQDSRPRPPDPRQSADVDDAGSGTDGDRSRHEQADILCGEIGMTYEQ